MTERPHGPDARRPHDDADLRTLLEDAVADVEPAPALERIRSRTAKGTTMPSRTSRPTPWLVGAAAAALIAAVTVTGVVLVSDDGAEPGTGEPAAGPSSTQEPAPSSGEPEPEPSEEPAPAEATEATLPVYYVGDAPAGPRLYREFLRLTGTDPVSTAVGAALDTPAQDPDYRSPWAGLAYDVDAATGAGDDSLTVALTSDAPTQERPAGMSAEEAEAAVAQLVWTATAAAQQDTLVEISVNGSPAQRLLGVDVAGGVRRGDPLATLAPVWVTAPQDGDEVGGTFTVTGQGAFFEANVSWQVLDGAGEVVDEGFTTASAANELAPYEFRVRDLAPGTYTLRVFSADVSGGEGLPEPEDTKRLTVG